MAMTTIPGDAPIINPPAPPPARPRVILVATALGLGAAVMAFAGLLGIYLSARSDAVSAGKTWLPSGAIPLTGANMALFTLLLSIPLVHWLSQAIRNDDRVNSWIAAGLTLVMGAAFINASAFIWVNSKLKVDHQLAAVLLFTTTGAHVAMVAAGMIFLVIVTFRAVGGQYGSGDFDTVSAAVLYWDVAVAIFAVLWYAIYITK